MDLAALNRAELEELITATALVLAGKVIRHRRQLDWRRRNGLQIGRPRYKWPSDLEMALRDQSVGATSISRRWGICRDSVWRWRKALGVITAKKA